MIEFNKITGHDKIKEQLINSINNNKISHAYIFNGEEGIGKNTLVNSFIKALQCESSEKRPCEVCNTCIKINSNNHPDIIRLTYEKHTISVDDIREQINNDIKIMPYESKYKIYIIDNANDMTEQAQNALLKTIEEPPEYVIIILISDNANKLLTTILSRCIIFDLKPLTNADVIAYLVKEYNIPNYMAQISASFSRGNIGKAIKYATSEDFFKIKDEVLHLLKYIDDMQIYEIIGGIKQLSADKLDIYDYIDLMILWYRDILMFKITKDINTIIYKDEIRYISKQAVIRTYEGIENIIKAMDKAKIRLKANVNFEVTIELMLLTIKEN